VGLDVRIILKCLKEIRWEGVDWIYLLQNEDLWQVFVNMVMNLQTP
jgi:hypothetical protein